MALVHQPEAAQSVSRRPPNSLHRNRDSTTAGSRYRAAYLAGTLLHALFSFVREDLNLERAVSLWMDARENYIMEKYFVLSLSVLPEDFI